MDLLSNLVIGDVYSASTMFTPEGIKVKRIDRACWAVLIKYEGRTLYHTKSGVHLSDRNNMVVLPKGSSYLWECTAAGHYAIIEFECADTHDDLFSFPVKNSEKILKIFQTLEQKRALQTPYLRLESVKDTYEILCRLMQGIPKEYTTSEKQQKIIHALSYIATHYGEKIKNDDLAALTGLSTVYFRKLFTQQMGVSPIDYVQSLRIQKAKEMLRSDFSSITDIAMTLGYSDIYDFSRAFKKRVGVSPKAYRAWIDKATEK